MRRCLFSCLVLVLISCAPLPQGTGVLEGHVTIGPLTPVVQEGQREPTPGPEVYASRQIVVFGSDGRTEVVRVQIDGRGNFRVELPAGTYVVDINHVGIDTAKDLPATVEIVAGQVTRLDVDIDTGIR
jgi:hypothetical protein